MKVELLAHTKLAHSQARELVNCWDTSGKIVSLIAIRTCYSANKPSEIAELEGEKYLSKNATDGGYGNDADRLIRHIVNSKHLSTLEHINFTFAVEGVSRSLLAQLTRHRFISFSVQSQRYVRFGSGDKTKGFEYTTPDMNDQAQEIYEESMRHAQKTYDRLRKCGVTAEDARMVLPNAAMTNFVMTLNLRTMLEVYEKRRKGNGAQWEIAQLVELLRTEIEKCEGWTVQLFDRAWGRDKDEA